jgi:hypothetical protein
VTSRLTSLEALEKIKASGLLPARQLQVLEILCLHGPLTAHEVVEKARATHPLANQTSFNARLSELERKGCVRCLEQTKPNPVSGMECYLWEALPNIPLPHKNKVLRHWFLCVQPSLYRGMVQYKVFEVEQEYEAEMWAREQRLGGCDAEVVEVKEVR